VVDVEAELESELEANRDNFLGAGRALGDEGARGIALSPDISGILSPSSSMHADFFLAVSLSAS
jgi:hypothetical protein